MTSDRDDLRQHTTDSEARFRESCSRVLRDRLAQPLPVPLAKLLARIAVEELRHEFRMLLQQLATVPGRPAPLLWGLATRIMVLSSIVDALDACAEAGFKIVTLPELAEAHAVQAVEARVGNRWGPIKAGMVLADIRKVVMTMTGACPAYLTERQSFLARQPRRDVSHRVFRAEDYTRGAAAIGALGRVFATVGRERGRYLLQGAAMLGLGSIAHPRRGEYIRMTCGDLKQREAFDGRLVRSLVITPSKTGVDGTVQTSDPRIFQLLQPLRTRPGCTPLFTDAGGETLSPEVVAHTLARFGELAVGQPACANILRRAATIGKTAQESHKLLRNSKQTTQTHYEQNEREQGAAALQRSAAHVRTVIQERRLRLKREA